MKFLDPLKFCSFIEITIIFLSSSVSDTASGNTTELHKKKHKPYFLKYLFKRQNGREQGRDTRREKEIAHLLTHAPHRCNSQLGQRKKWVPGIPSLVYCTGCQHFKHCLTYNVYASLRSSVMHKSNHELQFNFLFSQ